VKFNVILVVTMAIIFVDITTPSLTLIYRLFGETRRRERNFLPEYKAPHVKK
jgi:hypothetical protein